MVWYAETKNIIQISAPFCKKTEEILNNYLLKCDFPLMISFTKISLDSMPISLRQFMNLCKTHLT